MSEQLIVSRQNRQLQRLSSKAGFTLIELLAVIAIIGVLVGLLLPAVQQAREAARRSACINQTKQLALAVLNYEDTSKYLPSANASPRWKSIRNSTGNWHRYSWITLILPFMEEAQLYDQVVAVGNNPWDGGGSPFMVQPGTLLCPSELIRTQPLVNNRGMTNYRICRGDIPMFTGYWERRGVGVTGDQNGNDRRFKLKDITDGLSKTIMVGEARVGQHGGGVYDGGLGVDSTVNYSTIPPSACAALVEADGLFRSAVDSGDQLVGTRWGDSYNGYTAFFVHAPPNYPRCGVRTENWACLPASSYHPGGAVFAKCDGSTTFVTDGVDCGDPTVGQTNGQYYTGESERGVLGAMGSVRGGEPSAL